MERDLFASFLRENFSPLNDYVLSVFAAFDQDRDGFLNSAEMDCLVKSVLMHPMRGFYHLTAQQMEDIKYWLDITFRRQIDTPAFSLIWRYWLRPILSPVCALVVSCAQNDVVGGLAASTSIAKINSIMCSIPWDMVIVTQEWFAAESSQKQSIERQRNVRMCIGGTWGAELHPGLDPPNHTVYVRCSAPTDDPFYSVPQHDPSVATILSNRGITDFYVCGWHTIPWIKGAAKRGLRTVFIQDASNGIGTNDISYLKPHGTVMAKSSELEYLVAARDRRPESAFVSAVNFAQALKMAVSSQNGVHNGRH